MPPFRPFAPRLAGWLSAGVLMALPLAVSAQSVTVISEDFESQPVATTSLSDTQDADPAGPYITNDDDPLGSAAGSGVQVAGWQAKSGTKSLLVRSNSETRLQIHQPRSGSRYQLDFQIYSHMGTGDRNFYIITRSLGADNNGMDFIAYRADRGASTGIFYYQGIGASGWSQVPGAERTEDGWQHHRFVIDITTQTYDLYLDDMENPVLTGAYLSRAMTAVPTEIFIRHEGNSADDGYFLIDDISLTVEGSTDLSEGPFIEGFEEYPVMANFDDDADPGVPWITNEAVGTADGAPLDPSKVQVVGSNVTAPRSGSKCLKIEGGQFAGATYAWGVAPQQDVQITWWAKVPASVRGTEANYLRMSLYGVEQGVTAQGDAALMGYGSRDGSIGDETSLTYYVTGWVDSQVDYTPDEWEEYRLITNCGEGTYTIIKNPSSANPETVADRQPFIGGAVNWGPMYMVAWSSSNGSGHPPVYIDDIEVSAITSEITEPVIPYTPVAEDDSFEKATVLKFPGPISGVTVDPRDSSTIIAATGVPGGGLFQVTKNTQGQWELDPEPLVIGLDRPSGIAVDAQGTIWWTHDYTQSVRRLKAPWRSNTQETIIATFSDVAADDDPIDVVVAGPNFNGEIGKPGWIVVADRDVDATLQRGLYIFNPATIAPNQAGFADFLVQPTSELGSSTLNALASLDASGEIAVANNNGMLTAVNGDGEIRVLKEQGLPFTRPVGLATDPTTGRLWVAERNLAEIWSIDPAENATGEDRREVSFELSEEVGPSYQIQINDPGLAFSANGRLLVVADGSTQNRGGWLSILERAAPVTPQIGPITVTRAEFEGAAFTLAWQVTGATKYRVLRAPSLDAPYVDISNELTTPSFTDPTPPASQAYYKITAE